MNARSPTFDRHSWSYFNTPLPVFLGVMLPICGLMIVLLFLPQRFWIRLTAGAVIGISLYTLLRGYARRLTTDAAGISFRSFIRTLTIPWSSVRRIEIYVPSGAVNGIRYIYITTHDHPPRGRWDIDADTLQLQDRPGLLDTLRQAWRERGAGEPRKWS